MKFKQNRIRRILQIAPAGDAFDAVFAGDDGAARHGESVVVWGLVETLNGTTEVHGFTCEPDVSGYGLRSAEEDINFVGYYRVAETDEVYLGRLDDDGDSEAH